jgi:tRNA G18 (ribose-2'-O)-methylase SpoU
MMVAMEPIHIPIESKDDPRIAPYVALKERDIARDGDRFIAEGEILVRRLIASRFEVESVLVAARKAERMAPVVPVGVPMYIASDAVVASILGFKFHSGVMACGRRGPSPTIDEVVPREGPALLVVCPNTNNTENLGSLIRVSAGFGVDAMVLGEQCCDPFFRQSVRVSMGAVFNLPIVRSRDLRTDLDRLRALNVELFATVLDADAEPLEQVKRPPRMALLFGNEALGLEHWATLCNRKITLPMRRGIDSFNVAVSAGIFLYHFTRGGG